MKKNYWGWIILGVVGYIVYSKYLLSKSINIFYKGLDFSRLSITEPILQLQVQVNNPTYTTADLQNIRGDLYIDGAMVGSVFGITPITIATVSQPIYIAPDVIPKLMQYIRDISTMPINNHVIALTNHLTILTSI